MYKVRKNRIELAMLAIYLEQLMYRATNIDADSRKKSRPINVIPNYQSSIALRTAPQTARVVVVHWETEAPEERPSGVGHEKALAT